MLKKLFEKFLKIFEHDVTAEIKERVTNPFFVSLAISWLVWNWRLVFIFFNFDKGYLLENKLCRIERHLSETDSCNLLMYPIVTAFGAIVIFALLNQISLVISVFVRRQIRPLIYKYVGYRDIVDSETHSELKKRLYRLQEAYNDLETEHSDSATNLTTLRREKEEASGKTLALQNEIFELNNEIKLISKQSLDAIFKGSWFCEYILEDGKTGNETIRIQDGYKYIANDKYAFDLDMIEVDRKNETIKFRKVDVEDVRRTAITILKIISDNEFRGIEDKNTIITYKKLDSNALILNFNPYYQPARIQVGGLSKLFFKIQNVSSAGLEILSYKFSCIFNGEKFDEFEKHIFKIPINSAQEHLQEFNPINPLREYFKNRTENGIYDSEICLEYRINGSTETLQCTGFARLIVTTNIVVHSAIYGTEGEVIDVTEKIKELVTQNKIEIIANNELGGDPSPGRQKKLDINYSINGLRKQTSAIEGSIIKLE